MAKSDSKVIATIEVDIDIALNFLESQFPNPEVRWGELRSLIAKQKASEHKRVPDVATCLCGGEYYTDKVLGVVCCRCQSPRR